MSDYKPKTGDKCLVSFNSIPGENWFEKKVDWVGERIIVLSDKYASEYFANLDAVKIKPLVVDPLSDMMDIVYGLNDNRDCCAALHEAGYRKLN